MRCRDLGACGATTWDVGMVRSMMDACTLRPYAAVLRCPLSRICTVRSPRDRFTVLSAPPVRCVNCYDLCTLPKHRAERCSARERGAPHFLLNTRDSSHFRRLETVMSEQTPSPLTLKLDHTLITHMPVRGTQMPP